MVQSPILLQIKLCNGPCPTSNNVPVLAQLAIDLHKEVREWVAGGMFACSSGQGIVGTADVRLANSKTEDTGMTLDQCKSECASKSSCASFVFGSSIGY